MIHSVESLADRAKKRPLGDCGPGSIFSISPEPNYDDLKRAGAASVDLRLGRWLMSLRQSKMPSLDLGDSEEISREELLSKKYFVPFGDKFILHPGRFVLGATFEWINVPSDMAGYITGKSSLGRRGLIIETAPGIHPGFSGCLTLEMANVGEVPLSITPGMKICQVFFHSATKSSLTVKSQFSGKRRPNLGILKKDDILESLRKSNQY